MRMSGLARSKRGLEAMNEREILFRGKRIDNRELVEGSLITGVFVRGGQDIPYILCPDKADYDCFEDFSEENGIFEVDPETICKYTGLTDKNGRKIFEGDIVSDGVGNLFKGTYNGIFQFHFICISAKYKQEFIGGMCDLYTLRNNYKLEVIGNIFDNPELIDPEGEEE